MTTVSARDPANNLNLLMAVGQASQYEPQLVILEHQGAPESPDERIMLVGKGITFDTGKIIRTLLPLPPPPIGSNIACLFMWFDYVLARTQGVSI